MGPHRLLLDEAGNEVGDRRHLAAGQQHAHGAPLLFMSRAIRLDLQQSICVSQQLRGEQQQGEVLLPGVLVRQDGLPPVVGPAVGVVLHQGDGVQQPLVVAGMPAKMSRIASENYTDRLLHSMLLGRELLHARLLCNCNYEHMAFRPCKQQHRLCHWDWFWGK